MATISGIFNDPFGDPLPGVIIQLTARKTTTLSITGTNAAAVTATDGSYAMSVRPGVYAVTATISNTPDYLGIIQVYADSPDGTLNQYLAEFNPDDVSPEILREMQLILIDAQLAAKSAWLAAARAAEYALVPRGAFDPDVEYRQHDLVEYCGSEFMATTDTVGVTPPATPWQLFVSVGKAGPANELAVGAVTTLEPGEQATATISGGYPDQVLNLGLPAGIQGRPGPATNLSVGTVNAGEPGTDATVTIEGKAPAQVLNFTIPRGNDGAIGLPHAGDPGSTALMQVINGENSAEAGGAWSGSKLSYAGLLPDGSVYVSGIQVAGTWSIRGILAPAEIAATTITEMARTDGTTLLTPTAMLESARLSANVRNCRYSYPAGRANVDCEILVNGQWHPFTAMESDRTSWGPIIYRNAIDGMYGEIKPYQA
ncbi:prophage tail fiber N-terminal domain-containing protein [Kluyvera intermedia]|uniref:prophage tail fiber N-terminal domain-containing protein n=1 Tax=Kluyvera intermedia TaxID=61648 RepID=UPI00352595EC